MSTDRDTTRIVRSWLSTDEHVSADRVLDAVLDRLDTTPQRRVISARRLTDMSSIVRFGAVAAVVSIAVLIGYVLVVGPPRIGPQPLPSSAVASPHPLPDAFDARTITLRSGGSTTSIDIELPADGSLVTGFEDFFWRFTVSDEEPGGYTGSWGLLVADVTGATNHRTRWGQDAIPADDSAEFLASLAASGSYEVTGQHEAEIAGHVAVVADVTERVATPAEAPPSGEPFGYPHLDVNGQGGIHFDWATRVYVVELNERLILVQVWSTSAVGLEVHRQLEDRIISSIREAD